jgi:threonine dehydrogenase-like Zn-dependent dehydrogenase
MADVLEDYRSGSSPIPVEYERWHLRGAGLESLSLESVSTPGLGAGELLVRHDACGICFSDIKIINLGSEHPRLQGRDMVSEPVVMGHEVALTVVGVGSGCQDRFKVGQRFIVQADVYYKGANVAYGYQLDGGFSRYGIVTKEVLEGDEGCYLLPIDDGTGYVEAALVEPWACVVAAYDYGNYREGLLSGGKLLVVGDGSGAGADIAGLLSAGGRGPSIVHAAGPDTSDFAAIRESVTQGAGFDDVVVVGAKSAARIAEVAVALGHGGVLLAIGCTAIAGRSAIDLGRIHYEHQLYLGAPSVDESPAAYRANTRRDLKPGGTAWFIGAGGPMGQMHVQRAVMLANPPKRIVVSDTIDNRLERIRSRFGKAASERNLELVLLNPSNGDDPGAHGPYDDIVALVPSAPLIAGTIDFLAPNGVYNVFAGLAKGVSAELEIGAIMSKNQRIIGTSGSSIADLRKTLDLVESKQLSTNASLAAIGGIGALRDGLGAVKAGAFPGKTVIFPNIADLPLIAVDEMKTRLPKVHEKLADGVFWTREAEDELLREYLKA